MKPLLYLASCKFMYCYKTANKSYSLRFLCILFTLIGNCNFCGYSSMIHRRKDSCFAAQSRYSLSADTLFSSKARSASSVPSVGTFRGRVGSEVQRSIASTGFSRGISVGGSTTGRTVPQLDKLVRNRIMIDLRIAFTFYG